ncbi:molybdopterin molybdenumtransferase MoeA [Luteitalea sp. TBR-22]|uniref:molybdopterin molybdotransferase MoeA n=1 Tax=Luteitalea sp. TBR-22 TaxID=2802971 RepID=UPI001AF80219|nr:gephyrin-like molybdotransferase Glp [Luteitalea sp. TBR-22]BCS31668.1 molybdopterin molybdenumtransferase MoeA [Luteitalea sp. TBR-22]
MSDASRAGRDGAFGGMRPFGDVLPLEEARRLIDEAARVVDGAEWVAVGEAAGRVLAADVPAPFDVPGFDRSAMDGYAVRASDVAEATDAAPVWLRLAGRARPGAAFAGTVAPGTCVDTATGAPIPDGADAMVMVERTSRDADRVKFTRPAVPGDHVSPRANDVRTGAVVLRGGDVLTPARVGVAASFGLRTLLVRRRPVVALISSGDELLDAGDAEGPPPAGHIYDANRAMLAALCRASGADVLPLPLVRDTLQAWRDAFDAAAGADLIVCSGGSSVGEQDYGADILAERGEVRFHGIAVKPGKPTAFARIDRDGGAQFVLAMPGNPTSCLSNAYVLLRPLVRRLAGLPALVPVTREATLTRALSSPVDRLQFYPVRLDGDRAVPVFKGSGDVTSLSDADGYVEVPIGVARVEAGTRVLVTLY